MKGVKKREWYIGNDCKHIRNQTMYAFKGWEFCNEFLMGWLVKNIGN
jgi:hypothetical protein